MCHVVTQIIYISNILWVVEVYVDVKETILRIRPSNTGYRRYIAKIQSGLFIVIE